MGFEGTVCGTQVQHVAGDSDQTTAGDQNGSIPLSTRVHSKTDVKEKALYDSYDNMLGKLAFKTGQKSKPKKVASHPSPMKLLSLFCAALVCGFAVEFGIDQVKTNNTCSTIAVERTEFAEKLESVSGEMNDRMMTMTALLAKETHESSRLREELEHTKRMLKYFQGNSETPHHLEKTTEDLKVKVEEPTPSHRHWVQGALDDGLFKVWQVRYLFSEGIRFVRMSLPQEYQITQRLHDWEDFVAGPIE
ncbi:hypothetical protein BSKO_11647 [Bryopsis sp. KO-2023]|nr:hypothetical protein BSKO_11647 [Bryopsis sp. KO-2023]